MKFLRVAISILIGAIGVHTAYGQDWQPFTAAELASERTVDKSADAEALFWNIHIEQGESKTVLSHYIRIKIFTDRGRDKYSTVDISVFGRNKISDIAGRTIKPNGEIVELKKDAVIRPEEWYNTEAFRDALQSILRRYPQWAAAK